MAPLHYFRAFFQSPSWQMANHPPKLWYFSQVNPHRNQACEPTWNRLPIHMGDHHHRPLTPITSSLRCCSGKATEASRKLPRPGVGLRLRQKMLWQVIFKLKQHVACGALIPGPVVYDCLFVLVFICTMEVCIRVIRTFMACKFKKQMHEYINVWTGCQGIFILIGENYPRASSRISKQTLHQVVRQWHYRNAANVGTCKTR